MKIAAIALALALALLAAPAAAATDQPLPDVAIVLVLDVRDTAAFIALHERVLGAPRDPPKSLEVSTVAGPRGRRSIAIADPTFNVTLMRPAGFFRVVVNGRMTGPEALATLGLFQQALLERLVGPAENDLVLFFGLTSVGAHLLELKIARM